MDATRLYGGERHQGFTLGQSPKRALLIHGFPGTPAEMRSVADALLALGFEVRAPLLPGFGADIGRLGGTRWRDWVGAAAAAWRELAEGAERSVLLGFSMGGAVALHVAAAAAPDQLVLIAPFWRMRDPRAVLLPLARYAVPQLRPFEKTDFSAAPVRAQFQRLEPTLDLDDPEVQRALRQEAALPTSSLVELRALGLRAFSLAPRVRAPALVLQGAEDRTVWPADTRRLAQRLGGPLSLLELPGGHQIVHHQDPGHAQLRARLVQHLS